MVNMMNLLKRFTVFFLLLLFMMNMSCTSKEKPKFYSQFGQDKYLYKKVFKNKKDGVFVDIGAHDGVSFSNTFFFENLGWKGICIEPIPEVFERLQKARKATCIKGCISDKYDTASFLCIKGYAEMLSGILENYEPGHVERIRKEILEKGCTSEVIPVKCYNINRLFLDQGIQHVDYLSIDTEGGELDILKSIDFDQFDIDVIDVENNYGTAFQNLLEPKGYKLIAKRGPDEIYKKSRPK